MTHFLDESPLDFSNPGVQDLLSLLAKNFYQPRQVESFVLQAGISPGEVDMAPPIDLAWVSILQTASRKNELRPLLDVIKKASPGVAGRLDEILAAAPVLPAPDSTGPIARGEDAEGGPEGETERQIEDEPTLLDVAFLQRGLELAPSVARLLVTLSDGDYYGTAFRIADDLLLTNHHVLFDAKGPATAVVAWFGYERSFAGAERVPVVVECVPSTIAGEEPDDWAVIRTKTAMPKSAEILPLTGAPVPESGDRVYIIQHPNGGVKKIGMIHNMVVKVDDDVVQYLTDTEGGSSGSPVFNEEWQIVALHHKWDSETKAGKVSYFNQGRRIDKVLARLNDAGLL